MRGASQSTMGEEGTHKAREQLVLSDEEVQVEPTQADHVEVPEINPMGVDIEDKTNDEEGGKGKGEESKEDKEAKKETVVVNEEPDQEQEQRRQAK